MSNEKVIINNTTPEFNKSVAKDLRDSVRETNKQTEEKKESKTGVDVEVTDLISKSYSPTINRLIGDLESLSAYPWALNCSNNQQINIKKGDVWECVDWESKEARDVMLKDLKKNVNYSSVIGPAQIRTNCWFNVFFVIFFISRKGRKFFKHLRYLMITGKFPDNRENVFAKSLRWPFFLLNYYINSCILGLEDPINFAENMNTNTLLLEIGQVIIKKFPELEEKILPDKNGNPLIYYQNIIDYLDTDKENLKIILITDFSKQYIKQLISINQSIPKIFVLLTNMESKDKVDLQLKYSVTINGQTYEYSLDSVCMADTKKRHWVCFISGNEKEFVYDGASFSHLVPLKWKSLINKPVKFRLKEGGKKYSFAKCQTYYFYYRTK